MSGAGPLENLPEPDELPDDVESITDPGQYALRRRLGQILDARERVVKARQEAREMRDDELRGESRDLIENRTHGHIAYAVHEYAVEVEPLIESAGEKLETDWPEGGNPWRDLQDYINKMGFVPQDCPAVAGGRRAFGRDDDGRLAPPDSRCTLIVYRYLNRALADLGLDVTRADDKPFNRY